MGLLQKNAAPEEVNLTCRHDAVMDWTAAKLSWGHGGRQRLVLGRELGHLLLEVARRRALRDALDLNSTESGYLFMIFR